MQREATSGRVIPGDVVLALFSSLLFQPKEYSLVVYETHAFSPLTRQPSALLV